MYVFVHAQGIKTVHAGRGVKQWQNSVHVVVECPPLLLKRLWKVDRAYFAFKGFCLIENAKLSRKVQDNSSVWNLLSWTNGFMLDATKIFSYWNHKKDHLLGFFLLYSTWCQQLSRMSRGGGSNLIKGYLLSSTMIDDHYMALHPY